MKPNRLTLMLAALIGLLYLLGSLEASAATARQKYGLAERAYNRLMGSAERQKYRDQWVSCIEKFQEVYRHAPSGPWAAAGLFRSGSLYWALYQKSLRTSDKQEARDLLNRIVKRFPKSSYAKKARAVLIEIAGNETRPRTVAAERVVSKKRNAKQVLKHVDNGLVKTAAIGTLNGVCTITGLRYWSNPNYTRIVIDADQKTAFTHRLLKKDPSINKPQRLYIDLQNSRLAKETRKEIPINDNLLIDARAGQHTFDLVRVVADIKSFKTYKIFSLKDPFRIVVDVWGNTPTHSTAGGRSEKPRSGGGKIGKGALAKQLALGVKRIVIDPGHGGKDYGAPGYFKRVHEKNLSLKIAKTLAGKIREQLQCEVYMTRRTDRYLTLEERTAFANTKNADLFVSIHTNSARDRRAYGIETYFLNLATDEESIRVAARENATSRKNISDLQTILNDLMQHAKINESSRLATHVQSSLCGHLEKKYTRIKNKGVKQAPFYVLLGARMPAILIETSFISNPRECKRLVDEKYQNNLCDAIIKGIKKYIHATTPT